MLVNGLGNISLTVDIEEGSLSLWESVSTSDKWTIALSWRALDTSEDPFDEAVSFALELAIDVNQISRFADAIARVAEDVLVEAFKRIVATINEFLVGSALDMGGTALVFGPVMAGLLELIEKLVEYFEVV